jgi:CMP-N-acetylneuraminic acid synthetase
VRVAIIPARGGSRRIPGKNIREFHGRTIIAYSIDAAKASGLFERIVVTSDDPKIRAVARQCGAEAIEREMKYAFDEVGTQDVVADALVELEIDAGEPLKIDHVCCIYATAPLLTAEDLKRGYGEMLTLPFGMSYALVDGWYYWGPAKAFGRVPIEVATAVRMDVGDRWIDINTEEDWRRAERMYIATLSIEDRAKLVAKALVDGAKRP